MARPLPLGSVIGFNGTVPGGLELLQHSSTLLYALGTCVVLRHKVWLFFCTYTYVCVCVCV